MTIKIICPTPGEAQSNIHTLILKKCIKINFQLQTSYGKQYQPQSLNDLVFFTFDNVCACACKQIPNTLVSTGFWNTVHEGKNETKLLILSFNFSKYRSTALEKKRVERSLDFVFSPFSSSKRKVLDWLFKTIDFL